MKSLFQSSNSTSSSSQKNWGRLFGWGMVLVILGLLAISGSAFTTYMSVILIGIMLCTGGAIITLNAFTAWWKQWAIFFTHLIIGIAYLIIGLMLAKNPSWGAAYLTFMLGIFYIVLGIFRCIYAVRLRLINLGWGLFNGIITLIIGILILKGWPSTSLFVIGLFVGVDLLFCGWSYMITGLAVRRAS